MYKTGWYVTLFPPRNVTIFTICFRLIRDAVRDECAGKLLQAAGHCFVPSAMFPECPEPWRTPHTVDARNTPGPSDAVVCQSVNGFGMVFFHFAFFTSLLLSAANPHAPVGSHANLVQRFKLDRSTADARLPSPLEQCWRASCSSVGRIICTSLAALQHGRKGAGQLVREPCWHLSLASCFQLIKSKNV